MPKLTIHMLSQKLMVDNNKMSNESAMLILYSKNSIHKMAPLKLKIIEQFLFEVGKVRSKVAKISLTYLFL